MKVDYKSLPERYEEIKKHLRKETADAVEATLPIWDMYDDADFRPSIDDVITLVNNEIAKIDNAPKQQNKTTEKEPNSVSITYMLIGKTYELEIDHKPVENSKCKSIDEMVEFLKKNYPSFLNRSDVKYQLDNYGYKPKKETAKKQPKPKFKDGDLVEFKGERFSVCSVNENGRYDIRKGESMLIPEVEEKELKQWKEKKAPKQPKAKKDFDGEYVEALCPELAHIKRYCALHGKKVSEARETARRILASLQKAIVEKKIRKTSPYADEVMKLQSNLIKILKASGNNEISIENVEELKTLVKSFAVMPNIRLVKAFISIQGKESVKEKAKDLLKKIEASKDDHFNSEIAEIKRSLNNYIDGKTNTPEISAQTLAGLYGLCGVELKGCKSGSAVGSAEFLSAKFTVLPFTGKYKRLIGQPSEPFRIMIYGKAGSGKSSFALQLAQYIAELGKKVLFVANEEKFGYTLQEKMRRYNIAHKNLFIVDTMPSNIKEYDVVFIDSVNSIGYEPEDLRKLDAKKSFVFIFQCTKEGNFRGSQEFEHDVDTSIVVESFKANTVKNRFGGKEEINV